MKAKIKPLNIEINVYFHHISELGEKIYADKNGEYFESELKFVEEE